MMNGTFYRVYFRLYLLYVPYFQYIGGKTCCLCEIIKTNSMLMKLIIIRKVLTQYFVCRVQNVVYEQENYFIL